LRSAGSHPLEDIRNTPDIEFVMKNGRLYDARTLDEVLLRQRPLPSLWFHKDQDRLLRLLRPFRGALFLEGLGGLFSGLFFPLHTFGHCTGPRREESEIRCP
jgi:hypothetical protein